MNENNAKDHSNSTELQQQMRRWQFWFLVSFSLLLIVTFVYYLPLRFEHQAVTSGEEMHEQMEEMHPGEEVHGREIYHEENEVREGLVVNLNVTPMPLAVNVPIRFDFFVNEKPGNVPVPTSGLEIEHTKYMHVIGVRSDLNEFFHIHPLPTDNAGILSVSHMFTKPGLYKLWSEVKKDGVNHAFGHPEIDALGQGEKDNKQVSFGRNAMVGNYHVVLKLDEPVAKGHEHDLSFDIHTLAGEEVEVEDYLGANMHLTIIKDDLKQFIHTHPEDGGDHHGAIPSINEAKAHGEEETLSIGEDEMINFHVVFPEPGLYKTFAQFRPKGIDLPQDEALLVNFWIEVQEQTPLGISVWWGLLLTSIIFIGILSWGVHRYITVKSE